MKKLTHMTVTMLLLLFVLSGCSDDDSDPNLPLIGTTWTLVSETDSGCNNSSDDGTVNCTSGCDTAVFNANGKLTIVEGGSSPFVIDYTVTGNIITVTYDDGGTTVTETIPYVIVVNQLTLTFGPDPVDGCTTVSVYTGT